MTFDNSVAMTFITVGFLVVFFAEVSLGEYKKKSGDNYDCVVVLYLIG